MAKVIQPLLGQAIAALCILGHHIKHRRDLRNPSYLPSEEFAADLSAPLSRIAGRHIPGGAARNSDLWDGLEAGIVAAGWGGEQVALDYAWRRAGGTEMPQGPEPGAQPPPRAEREPAPAPQPTAPPQADASSTAGATAAHVPLRGNAVIADPTPSVAAAALAGVPPKR